MKLTARGTIVELRRLCRERNYNPCSAAIESVIEEIFARKPRTRQRRFGDWVIARTRPHSIDYRGWPYDRPFNYYEITVDRIRADGDLANWIYHISGKSWGNTVGPFIEATLAYYAQEGR